MTRIKIKKLSPEHFPPLLKEISDPPKVLYVEGELPDPETHVYLAVVGSRKYSSYGKMVCQELIKGLAGMPVVIVSGLALGMDAIAHKQALESGLKTIALPGSGLAPHIIAPRTNFRLARDIVHYGGALVSEFEPEHKAAPWSFPQRNRIMAGICHATLVVEASEKSGTLITARLAMEYNRDVLTVPGSIYSNQSKGPNDLIKNGATPITSVDDLIQALGLSKGDASTEVEKLNLTEEEKIIVKALTEPLTRDELIHKSEMSTKDFNMNITLLEIKGIVKEQAGKIYRIQ